MNLVKWGWNSLLNDKYSNLKEEGLVPGRIVKETKHIYEIETKSGRFKGKVSGHYMYIAISSADYPTIGDWVAVRIKQDKAVIERLLDRVSSFSRKKAGNEVAEQVIAANIDYIFLIFGLEGGRNYSPGAVERFLTRAWDSGASPIIVLNKSDLCENGNDYVVQTEYIAAGVPIHLTSAITGEGIEDLKQYVIPGKTIAFTGFSGVGKSALINALCGAEIMNTGIIRKSDLKGKHTTTHKELILLDNGGILIDSPGLKELQLWGSKESLNNSFDDISEFSEYCKFSDCSHSGEPGCAVQNALSNGELDHRRYENYLDMKKELKFLESKISVKATLAEKARGKELSKYIKDLKK